MAPTLYLPYLPVAAGREKGTTMSKDEALAWAASVKGVREGQSYYKNNLEEMFTFYQHAKPQVDAFTKAHQGGVTGEVTALFKMSYTRWLHLEKVSRTPALQRLAQAGQLTSLGVDLVEKEEVGISLATLLERLDSHAPKGVKGEDDIVLPDDFEAKWSDDEAKMLMPPEAFVTDVRSLPPTAEKTYLPVIGELLVQADARYKNLDPATVWALGRSEEGPRNHVLLLCDSVPGRRPVFGLLFMEWLEVGEGDPKGLYPCLTAFAVHYPGLGFGSVLLDTLLRLPEVNAKDHLVMLVERKNHAAFRCLEKIGAKHGRTLHKVGALAPCGPKVYYRAISVADKWLECCLSRGAPTIYPPPKEPGTRPPLSKKQARRAMLKAQKAAAAAAVAGAATGKKKSQKSSKQPPVGKKTAAARNKPAGAGEKSEEGV